MDFELIKFLNANSFNNVWFWVLVSIIWVTIINFTFGVTISQIQKAQLSGGTALIDIETIILINSRRRTEYIDEFGLWIISIGMFLLSASATLGFWFSYEFMQASTFLLILLYYSYISTLRLASKIKTKKLSGNDLCKAYLKCKNQKQFFGLIIILFISFFSSYYSIILG
tara:strand:- start:48 stop:557 length:510 start_codon:yes stop_codon:yes gene_type:complete